jgi:excisionase family DNA binding protein
MKRGSLHWFLRSSERRKRLGFAPSVARASLRMAAPPHSPAALAVSPSSVNETNETYLTVYEVADLLKLNQQTVRNLIDRGELPAVRLGRRVRVRQSDLEDVLESSKPRTEAELRQQLDAAIAEVQSRLAADAPTDAAPALERLARAARALARAMR